MILWLLSVPYPRIHEKVPKDNISELEFQHEVQISAIYSYLENKLLLISINFTPKTSHSCLNISKMRPHFFFAFLDHVHNFHDHGIEQSPTAPSTHKLGPTSVGVMTWSGSDRISCSASASEVVFHSNTPCTNATGVTR